MRVPLLALLLLAGASLVLGNNPPASSTWRLIGSSSVSDYLLDLDDPTERAIWTQPYLRPNITSAAAAQLLSVQSLDRIYRYPGVMGGGLMAVADSATYTFMLDQATRRTYKLIQVAAYYSLLEWIDAVAFAPSPECAKPTAPISSSTLPRGWNAQFMAGKNVEAPGYSILNLNTGITLYDTENDDVRIVVMEMVPTPAVQAATLCALLSNGDFVCLENLALANGTASRQIPVRQVLPNGAIPSSFTWSCRITPDSLPLAMFSDWTHSLLYFVQFDNKLTRATLVRVETSVAQPIRPTAVPDQPDKFWVKSDDDANLLYAVSVQQTGSTMRRTQHGTTAMLFQNTAETALTKRTEVLASQNPIRTPAPTQSSEPSKAFYEDDHTTRNVFVALIVGGFVTVTVLLVGKLLVKAYKRNKEANQRRRDIDNGKCPYPDGSDNAMFWRLAQTRRQEMDSHPMMPPPPATAATEGSVLLKPGEREADQQALRPPSMYTNGREPRSILSAPGMPGGEAFSNVPLGGPAPPPASATREEKEAFASMYGGAGYQRTPQARDWANSSRKTD
jgi:hypothetical protein